MRDTLIGLLLLFVGSGLASPSRIPAYVDGREPEDEAAVELLVAAPAELNSAVTEVADSFQQKTGNRVHLTFADSASLYSQIRNGTVFDAFFSTDMKDVRQLAASGTAVSASVTEYARDPMIMCISPMVRFPFQPGNPLRALRDKTISHIAVADAQHSVSGKAAEQALKAGRDDDSAVRRKLLIGKDDSQVAQFVLTGDADVALLPITAARAYGLWSARAIPIPQNLYSPIRMGAVVITRSKHRHEALEFLKFAASPDGRAIFTRYGLYEPKATSPGKHEATAITSPGVGGAS
jgi:molybdate transport system substrate-binding protein